MIYAEMVDRVSGSWWRLESIRICWGCKYLAPTLQGAPRRHVKALNGISGLHPSRQIDRVALRVYTKPGGCDTSHTAEGVDPMPRYSTPAIVMYANLNLPNDLQHSLSPRYTPERLCTGSRIDQQGQPYIIIPPEDLRRRERQ